MHTATILIKNVLVVQNTPRDISDSVTVAIFHSFQLLEHPFNLIFLTIIIIINLSSTIRKTYELSKIHFNLDETNC